MWLEFLYANSKCSDSLTNKYLIEILTFAAKSAPNGDYFISDK